MSVSRAYYTATTLSNGRVLVTSGINSPVHASVTYDSTEIFDPASGTWTATGSMIDARKGHKATVLNDGRTLVVEVRATTEPVVPNSSPSRGANPPQRRSHRSTALST